MSAVAREPEADAGDVELTPMRRRHVRQVLRIEGQVYPRPWSMTLFLQEIARRTDRVYLVARAGGQVIAYGGLMTTGPEAHITTIAVDPAHQGSRVGTRIMVALMEAAMDRGAKSVSLEVRMSNHVAQRMYRRFGFQAVGIRRGYYVETGEDALVMWADAIDTPMYERLLDRMREKVRSAPPLRPHE
ncbi:MAG: ribosomal protein S18-alanine N-acetyltransferase [Actinomycetota bacterium]